MKKLSKAPLKRAIKLVGGQAELARQIGVKQQHIWNWVNRDAVVPAQHAIPIEKATNGVVTRQKLRPDIYPA